MRFTIDPKSGVPFYRQIIDQVQFAVADGRLGCGDRLPTVRQLAVELQINPNTVARAYQELEIRGVVSTHMGTGTFIGNGQVEVSEADRQRKLAQICTELLSQASAYGLSLRDVLDALQQRVEGSQ